MLIVDERAASLFCRVARHCSDFPTMSEAILDWQLPHMVLQLDGKHPVDGNHPPGWQPSCYRMNSASVDPNKR
jgi:hypothetical protein